MFMLDTSDSNAGDDCGGHMRFVTKADGGANSERLRIQSNGTLVKYGTNINLNSAYIDFSGDISTPSTAAAIFRPADNTLAFSTLNTERLRITSGGNIDVNGTPPWSIAGGDYRSLSISGQTASSSGFIYLGNGAEATNADFDLARINICNNDTIVAQIAGSTQTSANDDGRITFSTKETGESFSEKVRIKSDGSFGVGPCKSYSKVTRTR